MNREQRRKLRPLRREQVDVPLTDIVRMKPRNEGVPITAREGVWVHSFICNHCGLHFTIYSWLPERHRSETIRCPECGQHDGPFRHDRARTSELAGRLDLGHPGEIFRHCEHPGARAMDDSTMDGLVSLGPLLD